MNTNSGRPRVLVIDDDEQMHFVLGRLLEPLASRVDKCHSAEQAKVVFERRGFDIVLCDLCVPGAQGLDLVGWLCAHDRMARCVVMTGFASVEDEDRIRELGARLLQKPFTTEQLAEVLRLPSSLA